MAINHRDAEHQLNLLLERVKRLARDGADRERCAKARSDRSGAAECARRRHPPSRGTDEQSRELVIGELRTRGTKSVDLGLDRGLAAGDRAGERPQDSPHLRRQLVRVHRSNSSPTDPTGHLHESGGGITGTGSHALTALVNS